MKNSSSTAFCSTEPIAAKRITPHREQSSPRLFRSILQASIPAIVLFLIGNVWGSTQAADLNSGNSKKVGELSFERDVYPILKTHCVGCHGESKLESKLDLRQKRLALKGGEGGSALVAGNAEESSLWYRMSDGEMPPEKIKVRPTAEQIATIKSWINAGARNLRAETDLPSGGPTITPEEREHWAYQPIGNPPVPKISKQNAGQDLSPVDAFLLKDLNAKGIGLGQPAAPESRLRRLAFATTGLPPTAEELRQFLADTRPDAWPRWVDHYLASPHYGEHWSRHWLDVAGYADTEGGNELDAVRADAWKYRDYVIRALNQDKPFDRFVIEQLAGDELVGYPLPKRPSPEQSELLAATGFLRTVPDPTGRGDDNTAVNRNVVISDTIKVVSSAMLGLTVGCAECHNHRYDPILQSDYYRIRAVFEPGFDPARWRTPAGRQLSFVKPGAETITTQINNDLKPLQKLLDAAVERAREVVFQDELKKLADDGQRTMAKTGWKKSAKERSAEEKKLFEDNPNLDVPRSIGALKLYLELDKAYKPLNTAIEAEEKKIADVRAKLPAPDTIRSFTETDLARTKPPECRLLDRGDVQSPKQAVSPGDLSVLYESPSEAELVPETGNGSTGRRLALARRLTSGEHPLFARVIVNRVWLNLLGRGLVETPGDFGSQGARPTNPELLDWLAQDFMRNGWSLKQLQRTILNSQAFRQSSAHRPDADKADPDNRLWSRAEIRRLSAEQLRDTLLAVSGQLQPTMFGPPVAVTVTEDGQPQVNGNKTTIHRRTVYLQVRRQAPLPALEVFDAPTLDPNCELRNASNVPTQALWLLNDAFVSQIAAAWAAQIEKSAQTDEQRIRLACQSAWGREPTAGETAAMLEFLNKNRRVVLKNAGNADGRKSRPEAILTAEPPSEFDAWTRLSQIMLQSNAFLYVD